MMQSRKNFKQNGASASPGGPRQSAPAWKLTRRGKMAAFAALAVVDGILLIVLLGMLFRLW